MRSDEALRIVQRPYVTEKTFDLVEQENKLVFLVHAEASKPAIKQAVETLYEVKVDRVNTARTLVGKKAYVRLAPQSSAAELASRLGLV
jgi:large subunit ribosomal protein L23